MVVVRCPDLGALPLVIRGLFPISLRHWKCHNRVDFRKDSAGVWLYNFDQHIPSVII